MRFRIAVLSAGTLVLGLTSAAQDQPAKPAAQQDKSVKLVHARTRFERLDRDQSHQLDATEVAQAGLGPRDVATYDTNRDQKLSSDEFVLAFHGVMSARGAPIADDLAAEVKRLGGAAAKAPEVKPKVEQRPRTAPAGDQPARAEPNAQQASDAKANLESKIDSVVAASKSGPDAQGAPAPEAAKREREAGGEAADAGAASTPAKPGVEEKAKQADAALTKRLRNANVDPEVAAQEREQLRKRVANALGTPPQPPAETKPAETAGTAAANGEVAPTPEAPAAPGGSAVEEKAKAARDALEQRLKNSGASDKQAEEARERLQRRVDNALGKGEPAEPAAGSAPSQEPAAPPPAPPTLDDKAKAAQAALEQRLKNSGVDEGKADEARKKLQQRIDNAGNADAAKGTPPPAKPEPEPAKPAPVRPAPPAAERPKPESTKPPGRQANAAAARNASGRSEAKASPAAARGALAKPAAKPASTAVERAFTMKATAPLPKSMPRLPVAPVAEKKSRAATSTLSDSERTRLAVAAARKDIAKERREQRKKPAARSGTGAKPAPRANVAKAGAKPTPAKAQPGRGDARAATAPAGTARTAPAVARAEPAKPGRASGAKKPAESEATAGEDVVLSTTDEDAADAELAGATARGKETTAARTKKGAKRAGGARPAASQGKKGR